MHKRGWLARLTAFRQQLLAAPVVVHQVLQGSREGAVHGQPNKFQRSGYTLPQLRCWISRTYTNGMQHNKLLIRRLITASGSKWSASTGTPLVLVLTMQGLAHHANKGSNQIRACPTRHGLEDVGQQGDCNLCKIRPAQHWLAALDEEGLHITGFWQQDNISLSTDMTFASHC